MLARVPPRDAPPSLFVRHYFYRKTLEDHAGSVVHRRALAVCSAALPPPRVEEGDAEPEPAAAAAISAGEVDGAAIVGQPESPRRRSLARDACPSGRRARAMGADTGRVLASVLTRAGVAWAAVPSVPSALQEAGPTCGQV